MTQEELIEQAALDHARESDSFGSTYIRESKKESFLEGVRFAIELMKSESEDK